MRRVSGSIKLRTLLIAVALAALALALWRRAVSMRQHAIAHADKAAEYASDAFHMTHDTQSVSEENQRIAARWMALHEYHRRMSQKYERAARHPWFSVRPPEVAVSPQPEIKGPNQVRDFHSRRGLAWVRIGLLATVAGPLRLGVRRWGRATMFGWFKKRPKASTSGEQLEYMKAMRNFISVTEWSSDGSIRLLPANWSFPGKDMRSS